MPKREPPVRPPPQPTHKSWLPGQKGQGAEGLSKGYGGSAGKGTGKSGPDDLQPLRPRRRRSEAERPNEKD